MLFNQTRKESLQKRTADIQITLTFYRFKIKSEQPLPFVLILLTAFKKYTHSLGLVKGHFFLISSIKSDLLLLTARDVTANKNTPMIFFSPFSLCRASLTTAPLILH